MAIVTQLKIAEPFFVSGGVQMVHRGHETNRETCCTTLFATDLAYLTGRVENTIACRTPLALVS